MLETSQNPNLGDPLNRSKDVFIFNTRNRIRACMNASISPFPNKPQGILKDDIEDLVETRTTIQLDISEGNIRDIKRGKNRRLRKIPPTPNFLPNRHHMRTQDQVVPFMVITNHTITENVFLDIPKQRLDLKFLETSPNQDQLSSP
ncbi:hypothetical protein Tco_1477700 [Tanacetum coccineum]